MTGSTLEAFRKYDFDGDARWREVESRLEIPPGKEAVLHYRRAKWYKANIDESLDPELVKPEKSGPPPSSPYMPPAAASHAPPSGSTPSFGNSQSRPAAATSARTMPTTFGQTEILVGMNAAVIVLALLAFPTVFFGRPSALYRYFVLASTLANVYKVYATYGLPQIMPLGAGSWQAIKAWGPPVMQSAAFSNAMLSILFISAAPLASIMIPLVIPALYHVAAFGRTRFAGVPLWQKFGAKLDTWLLQKQEDVRRIAAMSEIATGFMVLVQLLMPRRNIMLAFVFWRSILPMRFWNPDTARYHQEMWAKLDQQTQAMRMRFPFIKPIIDFVKQGFEPR